jgi:hypothetical protein
LKPLKNLTKLEQISIGNTNLGGSLEPLAELEKLETLYINDTDLNGGVEYLPESLNKIDYSTNQRPNGKVKEIKDQLDLFNRGNQKQRKQKFHVYQEKLQSRIQIPPK